eukprot:scaffold69515_cov58-Attheya_sp.AAC.3
MGHYGQALLLAARPMHRSRSSTRCWFRSSLKLSNNQLIRRVESYRHELDHNNEALVDRHRLRSSFDPLPETSLQNLRCDWRSAQSSSRAVAHLLTIP